ncbi:MAG: response regulator [Defluviitaleaceae bacterium]|nr:response regulator [Defluviitaleaceae bacterium]MCL2263730.1 response regulator [Defluviitaleaceae bacterium]
MEQQKKKQTIFLVDDSMTNLAIGKKALEGHYNVLTLNSGEMLLDLIETFTPDLVLLDVTMPGMSGYDVIQQLKMNEKTADIPVIFLTAHADEKKELTGLSLGAIDYITKPFSAPRLLKRLEVHLLVESQKRELIKLNNNLEQIVEEKTRTVVELKNAILSSLAQLVEYRDEVTGGHIARVQRYMEVLITAMRKNNVYADQLKKMDDRLILQSCQLHDVGKICVPDTILKKSVQLTPDEFVKMQRHTTFGEEIILGWKEKTSDSYFLEYARIFAVSHHEKWDGTGYPNALAGENIPLLGRMMAICDVYDALVEERPYKKPFPHEKAKDIITKGRGIQFDPLIVDLFLKIHMEFEEIPRLIRG